MKTLIEKKSQASADLTCWRCQADPCTSELTKSTRYTRAKLEKHLQGSAHSRRQQLSTAFSKLLKALKGGSAKCPLCESTYKATGAWLKHVDKKHVGLLWEDAADPAPADDETEGRDTAE